MARQGQWDRVHIDHDMHGVGRAGSAKLHVDDRAGAVPRRHEVGLAADGGRPAAERQAILPLGGDGVTRVLPPNLCAILFTKFWGIARVSIPFGVCEEFMGLTERICS